MSVNMAQRSNMVTSKDLRLVCSFNGWVWKEDMFCNQCYCFSVDFLICLQFSNRNALQIWKEIYFVHLPEYFFNILEYFFRRVNCTCKSFHYAFPALSQALCICSTLFHVDATSSPKSINLLNIWSSFFCLEKFSEALEMNSSNRFLVYDKKNGSRHNRAQIIWRNAIGPEYEIYFESTIYLKSDSE